MIQDEIRGWINKYLTRQFICDPNELPDDECDDEAREILDYLHSKGVVIRTDTGNDLTGCEIAKLEPLIKEETAMDFNIISWPNT